MKRRVVLGYGAALMMCFTSFAVAKDPSSSSDFVDRVGHLQGSYAVLGKSASDGSLYQGLATITVQPRKVELVRNIAGKITRTTLEPMTSTEGTSQFLKGEFVQKGERFQVIYTWHMDGDNDACFTGKVLHSNQGELSSGHESLHPVKE